MPITSQNDSCQTHDASVSATLTKLPQQRKLFASNSILQICKHYLSTIGVWQIMSPEKLYSFPFVKISLYSQFFFNFTVLTRLLRLINTMTKDEFVGSHFCIRSIKQGEKLNRKTFVVVSQRLLFIVCEYLNYLETVNAPQFPVSSRSMSDV